MFVDHVDNARCHGERNNSKDDKEGLTGPTDGLIQHCYSFRKPGSSDTYEHLRETETA